MPFRGTPAPGGARKGAGRKPSEFLAKCRAASQNRKFFAWANRALAGEDTEVKIDGNGKKIKVPPTAGDRVYLWEKLAAYGFGKPMQSVELSGKDGGPITLSELVAKHAD